jgi:glycosyltransferase involved in cell wall biosynthesis
MKVLVVSAAFPPMASGEATNAFHFCQQLVRRGLEVDVLTSRGAATDVGERIAVHPVMQTWSWVEVPRLRRILATSAPDVVYIMYLGWTYNFQFMSTFLPTIVRRALPDAQIVTRFENVGGARAESNSVPSRLLRKAIATFDRTGLVDYQFGTLLRDSDAVVLLSGRHEATLESAHPGVHRKCILIPPPANMCMSPEGAESRQRGRRALGMEPDDFLLTYIGFVYPGKGIETLLRALQRLESVPNLRLAISGGSLAREFPEQPSYLESLQALAHELGVAPRVTWTGEYRWDDDVASTYLRATDACVLPFDTGVKLNNSSFSSAVAHGLPIVTTIASSPEPQFVHRENVLLCPPRDPDAMADAIATVMGDPGLRLRLCDGSRRLAREWYSWEGAMEKTLRIFDPKRRPASSTVPLSVS